MKTSRRKYNQHYRWHHITKPKIVRYCNEHTRCEVCGSHLVHDGYSSVPEGWPEGWLWIYECPTCGNCLATFHEDDD